MFNRTMRRRTVLAGAMLAALAGTSSMVLAQELSGELVILQWQTGTDGEMWKEVEAKFVELNPGVTIREFQPAGGQGDARGGMRTALMGGEVFDIIHTLADEGMTMIIVTHHMGFARELADRVIFMDSGNFLAEGTPQEFFAEGMNNERIRSFLNRIL